MHARKAREARSALYINEDSSLYINEDSDDRKWGFFCWKMIYGLCDSAHEEGKRKQYVLLNILLKPTISY